MMSEEVIIEDGEFLQPEVGDEIELVTTPTEHSILEAVTVTHDDSLPNINIVSYDSETPLKPNDGTVSLEVQKFIEQYYTGMADDEEGVDIQTGMNLEQESEMTNQHIEDPEQLMDIDLDLVEDKENLENVVRGMNKKELERLILNQFVDAINLHSSLGDMRRRVLIQTRIKDKLVHRMNRLQQQVSELSSYCLLLCENNNRRVLFGEKVTPPPLTTFTRNVGVQASDSVPPTFSGDVVSVLSNPFLSMANVFPKTKTHAPAPVNNTNTTATSNTVHITNKQVGGSSKQGQDRRYSLHEISRQVMLQKSGDGNRGSDKSTSKQTKGNGNVQRVRQNNSGGTTAVSFNNNHGIGTTTTTAAPGNVLMQGGVKYHLVPSGPGMQIIQGVQGAQRLLLAASQSGPVPIPTTVPRPIFLQPAAVVPRTQSPMQTIMVRLPQNTNTRAPAGVNTSQTVTTGPLIFPKVVTTSPSPSPSSSPAHSSGGRQIGLKPIAPKMPTPSVPVVGNPSMFAPDVFPKPELKLHQNNGGIVLSWTHDEVTREDVTIEYYQIFASTEIYPDRSGIPKFTPWRRVGDVKALPLPMACTLSQFVPDNRYYFVIRIMDANKYYGEFCDPVPILLTAT